MQSRGLFNFFTKAADVQQTAAGARIARGQAAKSIQQQTSTVANKNYAAEQKRRAGMTDQQRWDEDFNNHLSDQAGAGKNQYNYAFDNYSRDLDDAVASGSMTSQQAAQARQHVINGVRDKQRTFHRDYLASFNGGDYTDADRNGIRDTKIWTTHGDNGLVHFRHGDFGENTTFGGAERGYTQRDKRLAAQGQQQPNPQVTQPAQQSTYNRQSASVQQPAGNTQAMPTVQTTDQFGRPTTKRLVKKRNGERVQSPVFKGGHAVNVDPGAVDWSARGDGSIGVRGMRLTQEQYDVYNNIRSQLAGSIAMQGGVDPQTARDQASMMAAQYIGDQVNIANGGKAFNSWQHAEKQPTPVTPNPTETSTETPPVTPNPTETPSEPQATQQPEIQGQASGQPVTWDLEAGKKDPMGYIKHHTQALDADTIGRWNLKGKESWTTQDGRLSAIGYYGGMAGRHYNNMQNLRQFATHASLSDKDMYEVMKALNQEAQRYDYYRTQQNGFGLTRRTAYDAKLHGPDSSGVSRMEKRLVEGPVTFGWGHTNLDPDLKDYLNTYFSNNHYAKSIQ